MKKQDINDQNSDDTVPVDQITDQVDTVSKADFDNLKLELDTLTNQLKRAVADYQNLEKRVVEGRRELSAWATSEIIQKIVPSLNHFEKALDGASEEERGSGWFKGMSMATQQLRAVLKDEGLEEIVTDGQFDPTLHEAVDSREGDEGKILEVAEKGYTLNGRVLKPAKVVVGKKGV